MKSKEVQIRAIRNDVIKHVLMQNVRFCPEIEKVVETDSEKGTLCVLHVDGGVFLMFNHKGAKIAVDSSPIVDSFEVDDEGIYCIKDEKRQIWQSFKPNIITTFNSTIMGNYIGVCPLDFS